MTPPDRSLCQKAMSLMHEGYGWEDALVRITGRDAHLRKAIRPAVHSWFLVRLRGPVLPEAEERRA